MAGVFAVWDHATQELEGLDMLQTDKPHNYGVVMLVELPTQGEATLQDQKSACKEVKPLTIPRGFCIFWENEPHYDTATLIKPFKQHHAAGRDLSRDPRHVVALRVSESAVCPIRDQTGPASQALGA